MSAIIIGSGFAGIGMAIQLKQRGMHDFVILEQAGEVGGVWRDNVYPGCACDVRSHLYSFSFEPNPDWTREFGPQAEILRYLKQCAGKYRLRRHIRLGDGVARCIYDEHRATWTVTTQSGRSYTARFLLNGTGGLSRPAVPEFEGMGRFQGEVFHSARWNHDVDLSGKRIAVIGTGASAIQFVPAIVDRVARMDVYQRTPPWILPKDDQEIPAYRRALFRTVPALQRLARERIYWTAERTLLALVRRPKLMKRYAEQPALAYLHAQVKDPALREKLTPNYPMGCKRILLSNDWYGAITREHVQVLTGGIAHVTERGVVDGEGVEREVDAIIFGTGFLTQAPVPRGTILGRDGQDLAALWQQTPSAYKGTTVAGFPNLFLLGGPNTGIGHTSMIYMLEAQFAYVLDAMREMEERGLSTVEVRKDHQDAYNERIQEQTKRTVWGKGCRGWYYNENGVNTALWPSFTFHFKRKLQAFDPVAYHMGAGRPEELRQRLRIRSPEGLEETSYDLTA